MASGRYVLGRSVSGVLTLLVVSLAVFTAIHLVPGGYQDVMLGPFATDVQRRQVVEKYGLDQSLPVQYVKWLQGAVRGDLGTSLTSKEPVVSEIARRIPATLELVALALGFALIVGVPLGVAAGLGGSRRGARVTSRLFGSLSMSIPDFVLGAALVYVFSVHRLWLTVGGYVPFLSDPIANLRAMLLPAFCLGLFGVSLLMRTQRDAVRTTMTQPFMTAAVARGETPSRIVRTGVLRNASIAPITVTAILIGAFMSGTVVVETLFSVPGIGSFFVDSVRNRDYAIVQAAVLISAGVFICANMLADSMYGILDPRVGSAASAAGK